MCLTSCTRALCILPDGFIASARFRYKRRTYSPSRWSGEGSLEKLYRSFHFVHRHLLTQRQVLQTRRIFPPRLWQVLLSWRWILLLCVSRLFKSGHNNWFGLYKALPVGIRWFSWISRLYSPRPLVPSSPPLLLSSSPLLAPSRPMKPTSWPKKCRRVRTQCGYTVVYKENPLVVCRAYSWIGWHTGTSNFKWFKYVDNVRSTICTWLFWHNYLNDIFVISLNDKSNHYLILMVLGLECYLL